jgi:hypothetical protein
MIATLLALALLGQDLKAGMAPGAADLKSAGPLAFAPEGILLVGDPVGGAVVAVDTGDAEGAPDKVKLDVPGLDQKVAAALGVQPGDILINDLAVNPASGNAYLSVSRGRGPDAQPVILKVDAAGKISEVSLKTAKASRAVLPNLPAPGAQGKNNPRAEAITDLAYVDGKVVVAGLSNEEFASNLRQIPFPFKAAEPGAGVEIFHGAHGRFETKSPVRTFAVYDIGKEHHVLAAYTCTPLVRFPLNELKPGAKVKGVTVAELGNRNRPLDMIVYQAGGKDFILMANSSRGMMKISTDNIARGAGIVEKVADKAGQAYETIDSLKGVVQLDRLNKGHAVVLLGGEGGALNLQTIALP